MIPVIYIRPTMSTEKPIVPLPSILLRLRSILSSTTPVHTSPVRLVYHGPRVSRGSKLSLLPQTCMASSVMFNCQARGRRRRYCFVGGVAVIVIPAAAAAASIAAIVHGGHGCRRRRSALGGEPLGACRSQAKSSAVATATSTSSTCASAPARPAAPPVNTGLVGCCTAGGSTPSAGVSRVVPALSLWQERGTRASVSVGRHP